MSLHGTKATFDPLSTTGDASDDTFTTIFESLPTPAVTTATTAGAAPEYDSFMTARSAMSYMTASQEMAVPGVGSSRAEPLVSEQPAPPAVFSPQQDYATPTPGPELPLAFDGEAAEGGAPYKPFLGSSQPPPQKPQPQLKQPLSSALRDSSNPFAAPAVTLPYQQSTTGGAVGPLSFGEVNSKDEAQTTAAFSVPTDLYEASNMFTLPDATAATAAAAAAAAASLMNPQAQALPPLYDFTREFSRMLPVSEDPASPVDDSVTAGTVFLYDNGQVRGGVGGGSARSGLPASGGTGPASGQTDAGRSAVPSGGGGPMPYAAAALLTNTVSVHSPRKAVAPSRIPGLSEPYTLYCITSRSVIVPETTVERRFRDVVALAELLQSLYPGCFVPPRPSRNAVEGRRMQPSFIEERRLGIEKFLRRLVVHPVLGPSEATQVWLRVPTADLRTCQEWLRLLPSAPPGIAKSTARLLCQVVGVERVVPSPVDITRPASERGDVYRLVHERAAQIRGVLNKVQLSATEERLREEAIGLQERSEALLGLSRRADQLVARMTKRSKVAHDLGDALAAETQVKCTAVVIGSSLAAALRVSADGLGQINKLYGIASDASAKHLTPLYDWLAAVPGAVTALAARERCLLTVATLESDEVEVRAKLAEAETRLGGAPSASATSTSSQPTTAMKKVEALRLQASQLAVAVTAARDEYERVGARNLSEITAFKAHMSRELADAVREFALVQLAAAQKAQELWADTAGKLEELAAMAAAVAVTGGGSHPR
ncbi:hypothetical protein VaNZ11_008453 [Volvox africanus]|uniref:PX domain-containing protein n=1 Tax=Volvox africanus TaxID=51714 RepID=A0ABQ5S565_9CHLO|nr:hypothetical protein VaNZ11_008453 [Volvox africanus]